MAAKKKATMLITLDKSQSGGAHEKALLASDVAKNPAAFNTSITTAEQSANLAAQRFVIGQSATHQISHTSGREGGSFACRVTPARDKGVVQLQLHSEAS